MAGVESWPQPVGCKAQGELLWVQKLMGPSDTCVIAPVHDEGRSAITPFQTPQHLSSLVRTPAAGQGGPNTPVLSGRAPVMGSSQKGESQSPGAALGRLQNSCCPFLVLWHHPVAAGRGLSLPCHHHGSVPLPPTSPGPWGLRWSPEHQWWLSQVLQGGGLHVTAVTCRLETSTERVKVSSTAGPTTHICTLCPCYKSTGISSPSG